MSNIKVRFAPSPTGFMHIGNTRTALFNWLWAKSLGGQFMLRVDDTDIARSKPEYEVAIRDALQWLGLTWNFEARQTERYARYDEVMAKLMKSGRVYPCYETPEELDFMRKKLMNKGLPPIYDRSALTLTSEQIVALEKEGRKPHYRFKLINTPIVWNDMVRGEIKYLAQNISDPIVIREDGSYLYLLPSVIDDVDFGITHIVRGEDHVTNTASQIQMFEAIDGKVPTFAHLPLLTGKEGKLSKRLGSLGVRELRDEGVQPLAIMSFLAKLGTSEAIEPFYSLNDLAQSLDFAKMGRSQPKFDEEELKIFNQKFIHNMPYELLNLSIEKDFFEAIKGNLTSLDDIDFWDKICHQKIEPKIEDAELTTMAAELLPDGIWDLETWNNWLNIIKTKTDKKGKALFHPIRLALTGQENGPELKILLPLIGREKAYNRLKGIAY